MRECEVADQGHWFTQRHADLFQEKLVQSSGNQAIAREAGRYAATPDALGALREFLLGLVTPEQLFVVINRAAGNLSRSCHYSSRLLAPGEVELTVSWLEGVRESPYQCENRIGYLEAAFLLFNLDFPQIEHTECLFQGGAVCRYLIRWQPARDSRLASLRRLSSLLLAAGAALAAWRTGDPWLGGGLVGAIVAQFLAGRFARQAERRALLASLESMRNSSERLLDQLQTNYDSALMINEIGQVLARKTELDDILASLNQALLKRLDYGRGVVWLADDRRGSLVMRSCFGVSAEQRRALQSLAIPLADGRAPGMLAGCFLRQQPVLARELSEVRDQSHPEIYDFFVRLGVNSFVCAPIVCEGESLGVLAVDNCNRRGELLQSDLNLVQGVAPLIGIAIRNAERLAKERSLSEELRDASEQLERRVVERTAELSRAHEELELLYDSVSHDLRTPVRVIYGYGELLQEGYSHLLDQQAREYLGCMIRGGEEMEATLDRMLDFSEVRLAELKPQPVDLSALAARILLDLRVTDQARLVSVEIQEQVVVRGDERLLKSVMENLLGNAWKYSSGNPESRISFGRRDGVCYVQDNGAGFDMAQAERLFLPFQRLHDRDSFAGHGLGLALVRRILERLGGKIWADSKPGEGATFYFIIP